jgi:antitoxin HicB
MQFVYPAALMPDEADGGFVVTFRDWPEAITQGDTREAALSEAADCLEEAVAAPIDDGRDIPPPSSVLASEYGVSVPIQTALKAALYLAMREAAVGKSELARRLGVHENEARRLLDPRHASKAEALERALFAVGRRLAVELREAA